MSSLLRYLFRMCSTSLKPFSAIYVVGKANINNLTFSHSSGNRLSHLIQKPAHPCALKIARASSSLCRSTSISCKVESHSLMLLANSSTSHGKTSRSSRFKTNVHVFSHSFQVFHINKQMIVGDIM